MIKAKKHRINRDIYEILAPRKLQSFTVNDVRNALRATSNDYDDDALALRVFVAREVKKLMEAGVVNGVGKSRNRVYHKSSLFYKVDLHLTQRRVRKKKRDNIPKQSVIDLLKDERAAIELELSTTQAEIAEYQLLIERNVELKILLFP